MQEVEKGSAIALRILDWSTMGFPFLLPDFAALLALVASEASVWKKWPGSVERDMMLKTMVFLGCDSRNGGVTEYNFRDTLPVCF